MRTSAGCGRILMNHAFFLPGTWLGIRVSSTAPGQIIGVQSTEAPTHNSQEDYAPKVLVL